MARDESEDDALSHLDERIAAQFARVGWRPSERDAVVEDDQPAVPTGSQLASLLVDLVVRFDRMERHLGERDEQMLVALDKALSELGDRMTAAEAALRPAAGAIADATDALLARREELQRADQPLQQVGGALDGVQAAMRAQVRLLAALQASVDGPEGADVAGELNLLRVHNEELAARIDLLERYVLRTAQEAGEPPTSVADGGAGETSADGGPADRDLGDEVVEPEGWDVDGGDERMF
jgi:hypothetical protein